MTVVSLLNSGADVQTENVVYVNYHYKIYWLSGDLSYHLCMG